jgi:hypothetical protein
MLTTSNIAQHMKSIKQYQQEQEQQQKKTLQEFHATIHFKYKQLLQQQQQEANEDKTLVMFMERYGVQCYSFVANL